MDTLTVIQQKYLETIDEIERRDGEARMTDIAGVLEVRVPSVSQAVGRLVKLGLVRRTANRRVELTRRGRQSALRLQRRHEVLREFMVELLGMSTSEADVEACRIEHAVSAEFVNRLEAFVDSVREG